MATDSGVMGMNSATRPPRATPEASKPFATRLARMRSSPYVVAFGVGANSVADTIAVRRGSGRKQLSAMLSLAPGSHIGFSAVDRAPRTRVGGVRKEMPSVWRTVPQNSSRCSTDHRWRSSYDAQSRSFMNAPRFDATSSRGVGTQAGGAPAWRLRPSNASVYSSVWTANDHRQRRSARSTARSSAQTRTCSAGSSRLGCSVRIFWTFAAKSLDGPGASPRSLRATGDGAGRTARASPGALIRLRGPQVEFRELAARGGRMSAGFFDCAIHGLPRGLHGDAEVVRNADLLKVPRSQSEDLLPEVERVRHFRECPVAPVDRDDRVSRSNDDRVTRGADGGDDGNVDIGVRVPRVRPGENPDCEPAPALRAAARGLHDA